jgi:integrase
LLDDRIPLRRSGVALESLLNDLNIEMPGKQAKILSADQCEDLLFFASNTRLPLRNRVVVLLSIRAGLRAGEIAKLTCDMVLGPTGDVGSIIELRDHAAKMRSGRSIPVHVELRDGCTPRRFENRTCHSVRARRPDDATQHRRLV